MKEEIWKDVPGFEGCLMVSSMGKVKSLARTVKKRHSSGVVMEQKYPERLLNTRPGSSGYAFVHVGVNGVRKTLSVHCMVLEAFVGPRPEGMEACHNNGNSGDNQLANLRWDTHLNNNRDRLKHGTYGLGQQHPMAKITDADALAIYNSNDTCAALSARYGISFSKISEVRRGRIWRSVTGGIPRKMPVRQKANEKMTAEKAAEARAMRKDGASLMEIAERFGITESTASTVCSGKTWRAA